MMATGEKTTTTATHLTVLYPGQPRWASKKGKGFPLSHTLPIFVGIIQYL